jgi:hypothetical protein
MTPAGFGFLQRLFGSRDNSLVDVAVGLQKRGILVLPAHA